LLGIAYAKRKGVRNKNYFLLFVLAWLAGFEVAAAQSVTLNWSASTSPDVAGYYIYYGTTSGSYPNVIYVGNVTSARISNLTAGAAYYFTATTLDNDGYESVYSNEARFIIPGLLTMNQPANAGDPRVLQFPVESGHWYEVQATTDLKSWVTIGQTDTAITNIMAQFCDTNTSAFGSRFYRLAMH
jgi:hypothetical protein